MSQQDGWKRTESWAYSLFDGWRRLDVDLLGEYYPQDNSDDFDVAMREAGYLKAFNEVVFSLYEADRETPLTRQYRFIASFAVGSICYDIYISDVPSLLELSKAMNLWRLSERLECAAYDFTAYANKMFRAKHGHDLHGCCPQCDPHQYRRSQEARQSRMKGTQK